MFWRNADGYVNVYNIDMFLFNIVSNHPTYSVIYSKFNLQIISSVIIIHHIFSPQYNLNLAIIFLIFWLYVQNKTN